MAQITVADISRWQGTINFDEFRKHVDAVIIKVSGSDGGLYKDGLADRNRDEARRVGLPVWFYHYKGAGTPEEQAQYMLSAIGGLRPGEAVVCDDENEGKVNTDFNAKFSDKMKELSGGLINVIYSNLSRFQGVELAPLRDRNMGAWVAKYGNNDGSVGGAGSAPGGINISIIAWQYTSQAHIPGCPANTVDLSLFYGGIDQFKAYGAKGNVPAPSAPPATAPVASGNGTYVVVKGDTLSGIGSKLGVDWHNIAATNGIVSPFTIFPGQVLKVYGGTASQTPASAGGSYMVVRGDTLIGIGTKTGHDWKAIASLNGLKDPYVIYPGQVLRLDGGVTPQASKQSTYTVVSGDYLTKIGEKTGVAWTKIAELNGIKPPYTIYPNQVLRLN
jgi:lysozyme